jgi:DNA-binding XRE family transcriptional regulator
METRKKKRLEEKGWKVGGVQEFLGLTAEENAYIELKLALSENLKKLRQQKKLTQIELAKLIESSRFHVTVMETEASSISLDLLVRSLLALGATKNDLAKMIAQPKRIQKQAGVYFD